MAVSVAVAVEVAVTAGERVGVNAGPGGVEEAGDEGVNVARAEGASVGDTGPRPRQAVVERRKRNRQSVLIPGFIVFSRGLHLF